ncbi:MAG TPA: hypothetical protein VFB07_00860 [Vicinamibacterales bacterium]|nr:hypothetical protein [Vicinamibacterales bacterium]
MTDARLQHCLTPGLSILVGTVDAQGTPACCRGIAVASDDNLQTLTVYVPVATSHETIRNVALTRRIAVAASNPADNCSTQLKGTTTDARLAREDEAARVRRALDAFADVLDRVGVARRLTRSVSHWPAFAITMRVEEVFEQTPGPQAGCRLR